MTVESCISLAVHVFCMYTNGQCSYIAYIVVCMHQVWQIKRNHTSCGDFTFIMNTSRKVMQWAFLPACVMLPTCHMRPTNKRVSENSALTTACLQHDCIPNFPGFTAGLHCDISGTKDLCSKIKSFDNHIVKKRFFSHVQYVNIAAFSMTFFILHFPFIVCYCYV